jgi:hypothetical protein
VADVRIHGTTAEAPMARFLRDEKAALRPLPLCGPYQPARELSRKVSPDCAVEVDTNAYSVPWRLIGERVTVLATSEMISVLHAGREVAQHRRSAARHARIVERAHFDGVAGADGAAVRRIVVEEEPPVAAAPALLRPLAEYEALVGGGW